MPASVIFLISDDAANTASNDNYARLPKAFADCGWNVSVADPARLLMSPEGLAVANHPLHRTDVIWPVGFGPEVGFLDRAHLLYQLPPERLITPIAEQVLGHGKAQWSKYCAPTHISNDPTHLLSVAEQNGGDWVIKPLAGSYARGVQRITHKDYGRISEVMEAPQGAYFVLQRFVPEIENGEIRTLVAAGEIIGSYRRLPINGIHANLSAGSQALRVATKDINMRLINDIVEDLKRRRIGYAAIDTVGDYLMEVNLANPGGLGTLATVYGRDFGADVVSAVTAQYVT